MLSFRGGSDGRVCLRSPGEGNGNPLQYSCLENPMDGGAQHAIFHGVAKSWTQLNYFTIPYVCLLSLKKKKHNFSYFGIKELHFTFTFHLHALEKEMATHSNVLAWKSQGQGSLVGCCL